MIDFGILLRELEREEINAPTNCVTDRHSCIVDGIVCCSPLVPLLWVTNAFKDVSQA